KVNSKILSTLKDGGANKFFILNNGITMIADKVATDNRNEKFTAHNYQIINGCQSSTMLYYYYLHLLDSGIGESEIQERLKEVYIPLKIIEVRGDSLASEIVESTNSQSSIGADQLHALGNVAREIQKFFNVNKEEGTGKQYMYYERRNNEYAYDSAVVKSRVITQDMMLGIFAATYLEMPHKSSRYAGRLKTEEILRKVFNDENPPIKFFAAAYAYLRYTAENRRHSQLQTSLKWHTLMVYRILFGDVYSKTSLSNKFNPEQEVKRIDESLSSCKNLLIANNIVLKFMSDNPAYSKLSIRTINKKEEFTKDLIKYTQILKGRKSKDKYKEYLEYVFEESGKPDVKTDEISSSSNAYSSEKSSPGYTTYEFSQLSLMLENVISEDAGFLFYRIFNDVNELGNLTFRWRNSDQKNSTYKFYIYISSKSGSTPVKVGQVVYGKRDKDFKINLGLQHKQLMDNPEFYDEFINRKIDGFTCDSTDKRNGKNDIECGRIVFAEDSSDDLLMLIDDIVSKTYKVKNSTI
ncbi:AIPR family protein, partial [uncultured Rothia sp.]|uniref:AIPR family protein n=1 Tax=uncultured Rothia sp. TaxID=316088 RepID=UPI002889DC6D